MNATQILPRPKGVRAPVLGANEDMVSTTPLIMGVAGVAFTTTAALLPGPTGLLGGATSMALGEWLSVQSSRELLQAQIETEREKSWRRRRKKPRTWPSSIRQGWFGCPEEAIDGGKDVMGDPEASLYAEVRKELGIDLRGIRWLDLGDSTRTFLCRSRSE